MSKAPNNSRTDLAKEAFTEVVQALQRDMPLMMHGSGDVPPASVNADSVRLLSELTAGYISNLVEAAVDSHVLLNGGQAQPLPPPPLPKNRKTAPPRPYEPKKSEKEIKGVATSSKIPEIPHRKRRRITDEFWDEPLSEPKIKNKPQRVNETTGPKYEGVPVDEWVGVSGVDFFETHRARNVHVTAPAAIGTQSFIFPVCHDVGLYGKVLEVQAARRNLAPLLADPVIQDVIRKERSLQGAGSLRKRDKKRNGKEEEPEETDSEDEQGGGAGWPGLGTLLPVHMAGNLIRFL